MTTWYAQKGSCNIDEFSGFYSTVWNDVANGSGNWMGNGVDSTFQTALGATDILEANGQTAIEVNCDSVTCGSLKTLSGGGFTVNQQAGNNRTIPADIIAGTTPCLAATGTLRTLTIKSAQGGSAAGAYGVKSSTGSAQIAVTEDVTGGSNATAHGLYYIGYGSGGNIGGNVLAATAPALLTTTTGMWTIGGNVTAANGVAAIVPYAGYATVLLSGNIVCGATGTWPLDHCNLKWVGGPLGKTISMRDGDLNAITAKVPDYPAEAEVQDDVLFDYDSQEGTYVGGGGSRGVIIGG